MKLIKKVIFVFSLTIIYVYVCNISMLPNNIILMQGETLNLNTIFGLNISSEAMQASSNLNHSIVQETGAMSVSLNLFNFLPVKDMTVNVIPETTVIPLEKP